eukprot:PITA_27790
MDECVLTEPSSFKEAVQRPVWVDTKVEEYDSIVRNSVWDVVPRLEDKSVVSSRWLYKVEGIDYYETFARVARLKRALYGLKQAPCAWYTRIDSYFTGLDFTKSEVDVNLYHIVAKGKLLIIVLYVDGLILIGDDQLINSCKEYLAREFDMKDMGLMHYFLGMEVWQGDGEFLVSQGKYANEILGRFRKESNKPMETPPAGKWRKEDATLGEVVKATVYRQLVGSLMYLVRPTKLYWKA